MTTYHITGTAHYASGFDLTVEADNEAEARAKARRIAEGADTPDVDLQEICIECVWQDVSPVTALPPSTGHDIADLVMLVRTLASRARAEVPISEYQWREAYTLATGIEASEAVNAAQEAVHATSSGDELDVVALTDTIQAVGIKVIRFE